MSRSAFALALLALSCCDKRPDQWDAVVYPDSGNLAAFEQIRGFKTFELCQQAAIDRIRSLPNPENADYECGYRCGPDSDFAGLNVCKETRK
jgi:hypothetical protein